MLMMKYIQEKVKEEIKRKTMSSGASYMVRQQEYDREEK